MRRGHVVIGHRHRRDTVAYSAGGVRSSRRAASSIARMATRAAAGAARAACQHGGLCDAAERRHRLHASAKQNRAKYKLVTTLREDVQALAVRKSAFATRANLTVTATFHLMAEDNDRSVLSATEKTTVSYNILDSEFATLMAQQDAQKRAIKSLGKDIVVRLAIFFDRQ